MAPITVVCTNFVSDGHYLSLLEQVPSGLGNPHVETISNDESEIGL